MQFIHIAAILGLILFTYCFVRLSTVQADRKPLISYPLLTTLLFVAALSIRLLCASLSDGFDTDTACFAFWADRIFQTGPSGFYSPDVFTDYPPGFMYLLYPIGAMRSLFHIS